MHESRLCSIMIDCPQENMDDSVSFWSRALGLEAQISDSSNYVVLKGNPGQIRVVLQRVEGPAEVHLDIATDQIPAEVQRLEKLGAETKYPIKDWVVMKAPSGHTFCVVDAEADAVGGMDEATQWESEDS